MVAVDDLNVVIVHMDDDVVVEDVCSDLDVMIVLDHVIQLVWYCLFVFADDVVVVVHDDYGDREDENDVDADDVRDSHRHNNSVLSFLYYDDVFHEDDVLHLSYVKCVFPLLCNETFLFLPSTFQCKKRKSVCIGVIEQGPQN